MSNGHTKKEYGEHSYPAAPHGTSDCEHGCNCWTGPAGSGGPLGLDPFGACPNNPKDGERREGNTDYVDVVEQRIRNLESRAYNAERKLSKVRPPKLKLAAENEELNNRVFRLTTALREIRKQVSLVLPEEKA